MADDQEGVVEQVGNTVRQSITNWGSTLRLCLLLMVIALLAGGWLWLQHELESTEVVCVEVRPEGRDVICVHVQPVGR